MAGVAFKTALDVAGGEVLDLSGHDFPLRLGQRAEDAKIKKRHPIVVAQHDVARMGIAMEEAMDEKLGKAGVGKAPERKVEVQAGKF